MKRTLLALLGVTLVALVTITGLLLLKQSPAPTSEATQTPQSAEPVVVDLWFHSGASLQRVVMQESLEEFNAMQSQVQVILVELPEGDYNKQVQAAAFGAAIAGDLPCLLDFDGPFVHNYVWNGFLIPLDPYVSETMRQDFLPSILAQGTFQDGKLYSLGQYDSGLAIWGNKAYLEAAGVHIATVDDPWTREEFETALEKLQALPEVTYALDLKMNYDPRLEFYTYAFSPILQSFGADLIDRTDYQSAEGMLNGPAAVAAMEMVQRWFEKGYVNPEPEGDTDFIEGKAALSWVGHWVMQPYRAALGDDLILLPMPDWGHGPKTGVGSWNWGITTHCEHPDAAWEVLAYLLRPELIAEQSNASGVMPARKAALSLSELYGPGELLNLYIQQVEAGFGVPRPVTPAYPTITRAFSEAFNKIARGADVQAALDEAVREIDRDIQEHKGYPLKDE